MTDQEINLAIAEKCGWQPNYLSQESEQLHPPSYTTDLNAMHEAEKILKGSLDDEHSEVSAYAESLTTVIYGAGDINAIYYADLIRATARQRAEAFLRTLGKWKD